ncbi:uncharacterized protein LOC126003329 [Suncus etruscus]|uniref:uncharacterized protein LOC126003329 n=1 Tax=Suncus etruscus TaxID=109475 RepID=UPI00210F5987|nr:uncharacterized protein LOC126003329 [Suncus etruscus]
MGGRPAVIQRRSTCARPGRSDPGLGGPCRSPLVAPPSPRPPFRDPRIAFCSVRARTRPTPFVWPLSRRPGRGGPRPSSFSLLGPFFPSTFFAFLSQFSGLHHSFALGRRFSRPCRALLRKPLPRAVPSRPFTAPAAPIALPRPPDFPSLLSRAPQVSSCLFAFPGSFSLRTAQDEPRRVEIQSKTKQNKTKCSNTMRSDQCGSFGQGDREIWSG